MVDTSFATLLEHADRQTEAIRLHLPDDWMQGRAGYGGLLGALALKSMRASVPAERKVRSLLVAFVGPVGRGAFSLQAKVLRTGKSVSQVEAEVVQAGAVCCTVLGSFGGDRESAIHIAPADCPEMTAPESAMELPYIDGLTPAFTRHYHYRWALGDLPFSGKGGREIGGWIQFREPVDCLTEEWLVALADAWPTPVLSRLTAPRRVTCMSAPLSGIRRGGWRSTAGRR